MERLPAAVNGVCQTGCVGDELPEDAAAAIQRVQALRRCVKPVFSRSQGHGCGPRNRNRVLVEAQEIAAGCLHDCRAEPEAMLVPPLPSETPVRMS